MFNEGRKGKKIKCEEENDMLKRHLGFQKTTNKVSIGRRLTKSLLKRKIFIQVILSFSAFIEHYRVTLQSSLFWKKT